MTTVLKLFHTTTFRMAMMLALLFSAAATLAIAYLYWNSSRLLDNRMTQTIMAETLGLAEQYSAGGIRRLADTINARIRNPSNSIYLVTDGEGGLVAGNVRAMTRELWNQTGQVDFAYERAGPKGMEKRHAVARIYRLASGYRLLVGRDVEDQWQFAKLIRNSMVTAIVFIFLIGLGGGWLVSRNLLQRIDAMSSTSRVIMNGDLSGRVAVDGSGDEIDRLAVNLNAMLERIEQLMTGLREVSDNIAHDLKTPLNRLRNRAETALREGDDVDCREALERTIEESDELIRTFNALLSIARLEAGSGNVAFSKVDMNELLNDVLELYEPLAEENGFTLIRDHAAPLVLEIDRQLMGQALANLVDNAVKYGCPAEGQQAKIAIGCRLDGDAAVVSVCDNGPGIAPTDRAHAMKRFGRLESSRSLPGTGLGLSLVAAVAKLHGGELRLEDGEPGLCCRIRLPGRVVSI